MARRTSAPSLLIRMNNKICVITGGTDGIGQEAADGIARQGARVLIWGRDPDKGARAVAELKARSGNRVLAGGLFLT